MLSPAVRASPDTHCLDCGEPLSEYGHCWQHHWPPMDPAQDKAPALPAYGEPVLVFTPDSRWVKAHLEPALDGWPAYWQSSGQLHWNLDSVLRWKPLDPANPVVHFTGEGEQAWSLLIISHSQSETVAYCNGQCGICSCISTPSPQPAPATPSNG